MCWRRSGIILTYTLSYLCPTGLSLRSYPFLVLHIPNQFHCKHIWRRHTTVCWRYTMIHNYTYRWFRLICMHDSCYFLTACLLCTIDFVTMAWLSIARNLNLSTHSASYRITYNSWHSHPLFRHHQNAWSHTGPIHDLKQACFLTNPQYSFCAPSHYARLNGVYRCKSRRIFGAIQVGLCQLHYGRPM